MIESSDKTQITESEFLAAEAERAKQKVALALTEAKAALEKSMDLRPIARKHPWISIASAATAGFVAALVAIPSKQEMELRHAERLRRAMNPDPPVPPPPQDVANNGKNHKMAEKMTWGALLLKEAIALVRPLLMAAITANIKSGATPPVEPAAPPIDPQRPDKPV